MIFRKKPSGFNPAFEVVNCFFEFDKKILLLKRHSSKFQGGRWGGPGGKVDPGEERSEALTREIFEETGLKVSKDDLIFFKSVFVKHSAHDFTYHMYHYQLPKKLSVVINPLEHEGYKWATPQEAIKMDLVEDQVACVKMFYFKNVGGL